jgi:hypothetical protein
VNKGEACALLGVPERATPEEINQAFRAQIKAAHPDVASEPSDNAAAARLNEARAVALGLESQRGDLVPIDAVAAIVRAQQQVARATDASERAFNQVVRNHVGRISSRKRTAIVRGAVASSVAIIVGAIGGVVRASNSGAAGVVLIGIAGYAALVGVLFGLLALKASTQERLLTLELADADDTLSDRADLSAALDEIGLDAFFTRRELYDALRVWRVPESAEAAEPDLVRAMLRFYVGSEYRSVPLAVTAARIGHVDFGKLLLAKGLELGLIQEDVSTLPDAPPAHGYRRVGLVGNA